MRAIHTSSGGEDVHSKGGSGGRPSCLSWSVSPFTLHSAFFFAPEIVCPRRGSTSCHINILAGVPNSTIPTLPLITNFRLFQENQILLSKPNYDVQSRVSVAGCFDDMRTLEIQRTKTKTKCTICSVLLKVDPKCIHARLQWSLPIFKHITPEFR
jgi:hypothetical protein